jgi:hypothetical protein
MRILSFSLKLMLLALMPLLVMTSCDDDDDPTTARISGTITIDNTELWEVWQDSGEITLSLFPEFVLAAPPAGAGWGDIPDEFFGAGIPGGRYALGAPTASQTITLVPGDNTYDYSFDVQPGTYSALALGFRHDFVTDPSKRSATLGVHFGQPNSISHGIEIRVPVGPGNFMSIIDEPAPSLIVVEAGDDVDIDFRADLGYVLVWPFR